MSNGCALVVRFAGDGGHRDARAQGRELMSTTCDPTKICSRTKRNGSSTCETTDLVDQETDGVLCRRAPPGNTPRTSFGATGSSLASTCYDGPGHCASWPNGKDGGDWVTAQGGTRTTMTGARNEDVPEQLQTCPALATTRCGQSSLEETDAPAARLIGTSGAGGRCWIRLAHNGPAVWACRRGREDGQRQSRPASNIVQLIWVHLVRSSSYMAAKPLMSTGLGHRLCPLPFTYSIVMMLLHSPPRPSRSAARLFSSLVPPPRCPPPATALGSPLGRHHVA